MPRFPIDLARAGLARFREALCLPPQEGPDNNCTRRGLEQSAPERGSAVVEFTLLSLLLMVPVVYFIVTIGQVQGGSFAVVGAADQAAKVYVTRKEASQGRVAAEQAAALTLADYGHSAQRATVDVACDRDDCLSAGTAVTVTVKLTVPLPMVPFGETLHLDAAHLNASATQIVGRFR
ncbi:hypothetical protein OOZ51_01730 [Arthrobacter sp. MI7-26]|uniref:hypothetical protein n=1 Tax=Arthrobacter sp. MI7-26 TaxID=2993653 RepID=UPI00224893DD|nr:hypothetical protein [Arthrobacter sp. MI7-26]MCX2746534.1 hypothetical protein [Arthrobacter sp. MI7-26]